MSKPGSVIEINGVSYDASGGKVTNPQQSKVIDGFVRRPTQTKKAKKIQSPAKPARRPQTAQKVHSRTQKSQALMRGGVNRPSPDKPKSTKPVKPSLSKAVDAESERRSRASAITRDNRVRRFGLGSKPKSLAPEAKAQIVATARPMNVAAGPSQAVAAPLPSMVASASHQRLERMLDEALVRADAHKQMLKSRSNSPLRWFGGLPKWLAFTIVALAILLLASLLVWRSMPAVAIKVADLQAHVSASLPSYVPANFALTHPINHSSGTVTVDYKNSQNSALDYKIIQTSSAWDSSSLIANALGGKAASQTSQVQGTTVYIYGPNSDATWVNNGIWYTLKNNANLSSDQILRIVQSM